MPSVKETKGKTSRFSKILPWILIVGGIIGIVCSLILIYDQIRIWENPNYIPFCSLNPIVSCGSVIDSKQGDIFHIPAPFFGLIMFPILTTVGVVVLSGAKLKRWFWIGLQIGVTGGLLFALWLFLLSMYKIHALCPFCLGVDVVVYTVFWYVTLYNIEADNIVIRSTGLKSLGRFALKHDVDVLITWFVLVIALILQHFWYFYGHYF